MAVLGQLSWREATPTEKTMKGGSNVAGSDLSIPDLSGSRACPLPSLQVCDPGPRMWILYLGPPFVSCCVTLGKLFGLAVLPSLNLWSENYRHTSLQGCSEYEVMPLGLPASCQHCLAELSCVTSRIRRWPRAPDSTLGTGRTSRKTADLLA